MNVLIYSILTNFIYYCCGSIFLSEKKNEFYNQFYTYISGAIYVSFISLLINFFFPLSLIINSVIYIIIISIFLIKKKFSFNKNSVIFLIISSLITFLLIIYSNVYRPDAGLYHLPFVSIINENKIIFGLSNLHSRFGHISILQYLSALNNNYIFFEKGIIIPLASIISFFYIYFFYEIWKVIKKIEEINFSHFFSLFILIYIAFKITRYSSFGNDAVAHLCFFYLITIILKEKIIELSIKKILLISIFAFLNKPTLIIIFIIPATIFLLKKCPMKKKIKNLFFSFPSCLFYLWLVKNIIVSGCVIYPVKITCVQFLPWADFEQIKISQLEGEAWSKGWPDRIKKDISMKQYNKNLNWVRAWSQKHLLYVANIIVPYISILVIILFCININYNKKIQKNNYDLKIRYYLALITSSIGVCAFFLFFPLYRYGYSYLISFISLILLITIKDIILANTNIKIFKIIFYCCGLIILSKLIIKIFDNNSNYWPNIYTLDNKNKIYDKKIMHIEEKFTYFLANQGDNLCMYGNSPCTSYVINNNITHIKKNNYSFLIVDKNEKYKKN